MKTPLFEQHCQGKLGADHLLNGSDIEQHLTTLSDWQQQENSLQATYSFGNFHETMAFVNAVAWVAHQQDHHPDLEVGYNRCLIRFTTHSAGGLTLNDFICAARVQRLSS